MKLLSRHVDTLVLSSSVFDKEVIKEIVAKKKRIYEKEDFPLLTDRLYKISYHSFLIESYTYKGLEVVLRDSSNRFLIGATTKGACPRIEIKLLATHLFCSRKSMNQLREAIEQVMKCFGLESILPMRVQQLDYAFDFEIDKESYSECINEGVILMYNGEYKLNTVKNTGTGAMESISTERKNKPHSMKGYEKIEELFNNDDESKRELMMLDYGLGHIESIEEYREQNKRVMRYEFGFTGRYLYTHDTKQSIKTAKITVADIFNDNVMPLIAHYIENCGTFNLPYFEDVTICQYKPEFQKERYEVDLVKQFHMSKGRIINALAGFVEKKMLAYKMKAVNIDLLGEIWGFLNPESLGYIGGLDQLAKISLLKLIAEHIKDTLPAIQKRIMSTEYNHLPYGLTFDHLFEVKKEVCKVFYRFTLDRNVASL